MEIKSSYESRCRSSELVFSFADWISLEKEARERKYKMFQQQVQRLFADDITKRAP